MLEAVHALGLMPAQGGIRSGWISITDQRPGCAHISRMEISYRVYWAQQEQAEWVGCALQKQSPGVCFDLMMWEGFRFPPELQGTFPRGSS